MSQSTTTTPTSTNSHTAATASLSDELKEQLLQAQSREEFTRDWVKKYLSHSNDDRRKQLFGVLCDPNRGEENVCMKLLLDYEIEPGYTVLVLILWSFISNDPMCHISGINEPSRHRLIARDTNKSGFTEAILSNLNRYGYSSVGFTSFDLNRLREGLGKPFTAKAACAKANILFLILMLLEEGSIQFMDVDTGYLAPEDMKHIQWCEDLIRVLLQQPSLTAEKKSKLINFCGQLVEWYEPTTCLEMTIIRTQYFLPITLLLLQFGADINLRPDPKPRKDLDSHSNQATNNPLMKCISVDNIPLLYEMILSQVDLLRIDLSGENGVLAYAQRTRRWMTPTQLKYSTPMKLSKRIIEKLHQWQEEQKKSITADANYQPNDAPMRQWLKDELASLPNQLFSATLQYYMSKDGMHDDKNTADRRRREYTRRWIDQMKTAPLHINLLEVSDREHNQTFLGDSIEVFLSPDFRSLLPELYRLVDEIPIDGLILFGTGPITSIFSTLIHYFDEFRLEQHTAEEQASRVEILSQLFKQVVKRLNSLLEGGRIDTNATDGGGSVGSDSSFPLPSDPAGSDATSSLINGIEGSIWYCACHLGSYPKLATFRLLWLEILPILREFRVNEAGYRGIFLDHLFGQINQPTTQSFERIRVFIDDDFFQSSDLFLPLRFKRLDPTNVHRYEGLTLIQLIQTRLDAYDVGREVNPNDRTRVLEFMMQRSKQWQTIHFPRIRSFIEEHLITDLATIVMEYIQPIEMRADIPAVHPSQAPTPFTLDVGMNSSVFTLGTSSTSSPQSATTAPEQVVANGTNETSFTSSSATHPPEVTKFNFVFPSFMMNVNPSSDTGTVYPTTGPGDTSAIPSDAANNPFFLQPLATPLASTINLGVSTLAPPTILPGSSLTSSAYPSASASAFSFGKEVSIPGPNQPTPSVTTTPAAFTFTIPLSTGPTTAAASNPWATPNTTTGANSHTTTSSSSGGSLFSRSARKNRIDLSHVRGT